MVRPTSCVSRLRRGNVVLDRYAGDDVALVAYGKAWNALRAMDERLERLSSQESSMRQQADYLRESIERINRIDPQPGRWPSCVPGAIALRTRPKSPKGEPCVERIGRFTGC